NKDYKEYYACATGEAAPKLKASARKKKGDSDYSSHSNTNNYNEGTGSKPEVPDVPSDDSEEKLSWNSSDDEDVGGHDEGNKSDESDDE
nr:hypothetical protein [Tanacetum cinerariifolium]